MGTFLATDRMSPALQRRVLASVRGVREVSEPRSTRWRPRLIALGRAMGVVALVAVVASVALARARDRRDFERARESLLQTAQVRGGGVTPEDLGTPGRVDTWLVRLSGAYDGDVIAEELRGPAALSAALTRPAIYVRGPIDQMHTGAAIAEAAASSLKDPLLACLVDPPSSRSEKALLAEVHEVFAAGAEPRSRNVRRLREAHLGLPFLAQAWAATVRSAKHPEDLDLLRAHLEAAPIEAAVRAARARLLLFVMDEPGDGSGPTELDGERAHAVRVGLIDLASSKVLLQLRRRVDPSWISAGKRPMYAAALDSCALALDVRDGVAAWKRATL